MDLEDGEDHEDDVADILIAVENDQSGGLVSRHGPAQFHLLQSPTPHRPR